MSEPRPDDGAIHSDSQPEQAPSNSAEPAPPPHRGDSPGGEAADTFPEPGDFDERIDQHLQGGSWNPLANLADLKMRLEGDARDGDAVAAHLQELAEDMVDLLRRVVGLEAAQAGLAAQFGQLNQTLEKGLFLQAREVDTLRRELIGQQRGLLALHILEVIAPALDRLRIMRRALNPRRDQRMIGQLEPTIEILNQAIRSLGFVAFEPQVGEPFDPQRMAVAGNAKGAPGVVLGVERPGYLVQESVVRPAGVVVAEAHAVAAP